jgi:hypothetical protein
MKRPACIFTKVYNEPRFFPVWLDYYSRWFEPQDIHVLHALKPNRCEFDDWMPGAEFMYYPMGEPGPHDMYLDSVRVMREQRRLLEHYEKVIYTDVDEILYSPVGLAECVRQWPGGVACAKGFEVVHQWHKYSTGPLEPSRLTNAVGPYQETPEARLDWSRPLLAQRHWWYHSRTYSKPLLTSVPVDWEPGFHRVRGSAVNTISDDLILLHLHKIDYASAKERQRSRLANEPEWQANALENDVPGYQFYLDGDRYDRWWFESIDHPGEGPAPLRLMPEEIRSLL